MKLKRVGIVAAVIAVGAAGVAFGQPMDVDEVVKLIKNNFSDNIIIARIEETESYFNLSTDDLIELKEAGASDALVQYMILRKPGGTPPTTGTGTSTGISTAGRTGTPTEVTPPSSKYVDLTVNVTGKYVVSSSQDLNVYYAAYVDGEKKYYVDQWKKIYSLTTAETGHTATRRIFEPGSFTIKAPVGSHTLSLVLWSGQGFIDDRNAKAYVIYTKTFTAAEGQPLVFNLTGETDEAGKFNVR
ncbi:MAG: hypothetical protein JSU81_06700 [Candidatus Coatesbacteria bacterium]|nr:MAG: hypothetical protein JSU81_06700 [Candidatus Coatesbacteria bacterium]